MFKIKGYLSLFLALLMAFSVALPSAAGAAAKEVVQLTVADIQAMNDGKATLVASADGRLTTLIGTFYDGKVENFDDAVKAISGVRTLLGVEKGTDILHNYHISDDKGNVWYTFSQVYDQVVVYNGVVKVLVNPEGKTIALSSSLVPGKAGSEEKTAVTKAQALEIVKAQMEAGKPSDSSIAANSAYTYYPDSTELTMMEVIPKSGSVAVYIVYTNNPGINFNEHSLAYLAHYVIASGDMAGEYFNSLPVATPGSAAKKTAMDNQSIFEGKKETTYTGTVKRHDGSEMEVTVPVLYDESNGVYYLADPSRKIAVADYSAFFKTFQPTFTSTKDNTGWEDETLIAYQNYIKIYDVFAGYGLKSVDGLGTPILILADYLDAWGKPIYNAAYMGLIFGWHCIGTSTNGGLEEAIDVLAHEYTHGVTASLLGGQKYENDTGAINESFSDIMGNISELLTDSTKDTTWLIAEASGKAVRNMSDPIEYKQPKSVGDVYYVPNSDHPNLDYNDQGGVHTNSSLLNYAAYELNAAGMTLEQQRDVWLDVLSSLTPASGYGDIYAFLKLAVTNYGLDQYQEKIDEIFTSLGVLGNKKALFRGATRDGYGRLLFNVVADKALYPFQNIKVVEAKPNEDAFVTQWADNDGVVSILLPAGSYYLYAKFINNATGEMITLSYSQDGWSEKAVPVVVEAGAVIPLDSCRLSA